MELDLPTDAMIYADGVYTCFELEDFLKEDERIHLLAKRGKAVKQRRWKPNVQKKISGKRQIVETVWFKECLRKFLKGREPNLLLRPAFFQLFQRLLKWNWDSVCVPNPNPIPYSV